MRPMLLMPTSTTENTGRISTEFETKALIYGRIEKCGGGERVRTRVVARVDNPPIYKGIHVSGMGMKITEHHDTVSMSLQETF